MNHCRIGSLFVAACLGFAVTACAPKVDESLDHIGHRLDFEKFLHYAIMDSLAYEGDAAVHAAYGGMVRQVGTLPATDGRYFVLRDTANKSITIAVRGTANSENALQDADFIQTNDNELGLPFHSGFKRSTEELLDSIADVIGPHKSDHTINLTGHSLGGAIAVVAMIHLEQEGYTIGEVITLGQPKVTTVDVHDVAGVEPLRLINRDDLVPLVPPNNPAATSGGYVHFGKAVMLLPGKYFVGMAEHLAEDEAVTSFWANVEHEKVTDHFVSEYTKNIRSKLKEQEEVAYNDREKYNGR